MTPYKRDCLRAESLCVGCRHLSRDDGPLPFCSHPTVIAHQPKGLHLPIAAKKFCGEDRRLKETRR